MCHSRFSLHRILTWFTIHLVSNQMGGVNEQTCMEIPTNLYIVYIHIMPTKNLLTLQTLLAGK